MLGVLSTKSSGQRAELRLHRVIAGTVETDASRFEPRPTADELCAWSNPSEPQSPGGGDPILRES